ncbi:MAG: hypothetical protein [Microviridae sp.]|nr:MAG: hypothetical protein [Microviridae sp.]
MTNYRKFDTRNANRQNHVTDVTNWTQAASIPKHDPESDINVIYRKTQLGQNVSSVSKMPTFGDFSNLLQYDQMLESIHAAESAFAELPALERRKYNDDPKEYYAQTLENLKKDAANADAIERAQALATQKQEEIQKAVNLLKANPQE